MCPPIMCPPIMCPPIMCPPIGPPIGPPRPPPRGGPSRSLLRSPAIFTTIVFPSNIVRCKPAFALAAWSSETNSTNPNPRALPSLVCRTACARRTSPNRSNNALSESSVTWSAKEPTNSLHGLISFLSRPPPPPPDPKPGRGPGPPDSWFTPSSLRKLWYSDVICLCAPAAAAGSFLKGQSTVGCPPSPQILHVTSSAGALYPVPALSISASAMPAAVAPSPRGLRRVPLMSANSRSCARLCSL